MVHMGMLPVLHRLGDVYRFQWTNLCILCYVHIQNRLACNIVNYNAGLPEAQRLIQYAGTYVILLGSRLRQSTAQCLHYSHPRGGSFLINMHTHVIFMFRRNRAVAKNLAKWKRALRHLHYTSIHASLMRDLRMVKRFWFVVHGTSHFRNKTSLSSQIYLKEKMAITVCDFMTVNYFSTGCANKQRSLRKN